MSDGWMDDEAQLFRNSLIDLGFTQSSLARRMQDLGDPRAFATILRSVANWHAGNTRVPGEMFVVLKLLEMTAAAPAPARSAGR